MDYPFGPPVGVPFTWRDDRADTKKREAISEVKRLYDEGVPYITKEALRDVQQQLQNPPKSGKFWLKGLNGKTVEFDLGPASVCKDYKESSDLEIILDKPAILYHSIQHLTTPSKHIAYPQQFCSIHVCWQGRLRNKITKEAAETPGTQPYEDTYKLFQDTFEQWDASETCQKLRSILLSVDIPCEIDKVIGFACASISSSHDPWSLERSLFQHALLLTLQDVLRQKGQKEEYGAEDGASSVPCYVQDPLYTDVDKSVLHDRGITMLDDPEGFIRVDDRSVVFSCAPNVPVRQIVTELARPAIMIWTKLGLLDGFFPKDTLVTDPDSPRIEEMLRTFYDEIEFPGDLDHFGDVAMYIRRAGYAAGRTQ